MGKVLNAEGSGYLPFCIKPASVVPQQFIGTLYPFALTLDQLVSLFWRVKKWTYEDNLGPIGESFQLFSEPPNEEYIVCNYNLYSYFRDFPRGSSIFTFELFNYLNYDVLKVGNLYYPYVFFDGAISGQGDFFTANNSSPYPESGIFTMSWLGYNLSTPLYTGRFIPPNIFNAKFTATEYWSYGGTYDTSTGLPL